MFLLAHQDDEIPFAPLLARLKKEGQPVFVVYLTDGGAGRASPQARSDETTRALASLGVAPSEISFLGVDLAVPDCQSYRHFTLLWSELAARTSSFAELGEVYTLAWEGGNADHDAAHVLAAALAVCRGRLQMAWQLPFYRAVDRGPPRFSVFAPLSANGPVHRIPLTSRESRLRVWMLRFYPSQWRAFLGLGPFIVWHALAGREIKLQSLQLHRLWQRPTPVTLLYEQRQRVRFDEFMDCAAGFLRERGITPDSGQNLESADKRRSAASSAE